MTREYLVKVLQRDVNCITVKGPPQGTQAVQLTTVLILLSSPKESCLLGQTHTIPALIEAEVDTEGQFYS